MYHFDIVIEPGRMCCYQTNRQAHLANLETLCIFVVKHVSHCVTYTHNLYYPPAYICKSIFISLTLQFTFNVCKFGKKVKVYDNKKIRIHELFHQINAILYIDELLQTQTCFLATIKHRYCQTQILLHTIYYITFIIFSFAMQS